MGKYAIFICSNDQYLPFLNVLLNSIEKYNIDADVFLMHYEFPEAYIKDAQEKFSFQVIPLEIRHESFNIHEFNEQNRNLFIKQARFKYIREHGMGYDVICMLDADMFITTHNFTNLFQMVEGTDKLIGCNERFKWVFDHRYVAQGKPIFDTQVKALKFHCSVPIIFDLKKWTEVFDTYNDLAYNAFEVDDDDKILKPIGDIYCWNISVYKHDRQNDVVLFPMETMTQVHHTYALPWTRLIQHNGSWLTFAGDEVFSIHGRIGNKGWLEGQVMGTKKWLKEHAKEEENAIIEWRIESTLKLVQREWYNLNFRHILNLYGYLPVNEYWETFKN